jgi:hypothetical protein
MRLFLVCVVSKWSPWSECTGSCKFALQVRNRDVLRPPFPEIDLETGESLTKPCPPLYETRECQPVECQLGEEVHSSTQPARDDFFRDLPIIRSVVSDTAKSPFESDKILSRPIWRKVPETVPIEARRPTQLKRPALSHRPNCKN